MIEKITTKYPDFDDLKYTINELVDAVNELQAKDEEIAEWIAIVGDLRKQVRELQAKVNKLAPNINFVQPEVKENVQDELDCTRKVLSDTIKLAEQMLESIEDEGMCSEYYEDELNKIKALKQKDIPL